jgi:hypothetical protein
MYASDASLKKDPESATEIVAGAEKQRCSIAQQFFSISVQSFLRRFDSKHGLKLSKAAGKLTDYKGKRQFVELRKIVSIHNYSVQNLFITFSAFRHFTWSNSATPGSSSPEEVELPRLSNNNVLRTGAS